MEDTLEIKDPNQLDLFLDQSVDEVQEPVDQFEYDIYNSPEILGWNSTEEQETLFFALQLFYHPAQSVLDVGAGRGDLYGYMKKLYQDAENPERNWNPSLYSGIDFNPNIVEIGKEKFPGIELAAGDLFELDESVRYDWCIANGTFNLRIGDYDMLEYTKKAIDKMVNIAEHGVAFNLLTSYDDSMNQEVIDAIYKFDAGDMLNYLTEKYGKVICRTDYFPGDATFFIFK